MDSDSDAGIHALAQLGELLISSILQGESIDNIKSFVAQGAPLWYQNDSEGISPLHAAAYVQDEEMVKFLLEEGAVWNSVDNLKNTAGDIALSFNNEVIYSLIRNAGIRAEMLLSLLSSRSSSEPSSSLLIRSEDVTAAASTDVFLSSRLKFMIDENGQEICVVTAGDDEIGVMMGWEQKIMEETVKGVTEGHENLQNLKVLNIGFGLGMIDSLFQALSSPPAVHYIVEAHPDVLQHMKELGWYEKTGVRILEGKWQDSMDELISVGGFDVVYTDTFSENYKDLHGFFESLPDLLAGPESRFSFFNGLGATNALFYDVYTHLSELHLADVGVDIQWRDVRVFDDEYVDRWGKTREYFKLPVYRLPIGAMKSF